jgi:hypothetical protein
MASMHARNVGYTFGTVWHGVWDDAREPECRDRRPANPLFLFFPKTASATPTRGRGAAL